MVCYGCEKRRVGCHAKCPEYRAEMLARQVAKDEQRKQLEADYEVDDYIANIRSRIKRGRFRL